ncbi:hypothetical protein WJX72_011288 [[Myrmecia] bisecta]|uniref:Uncharacterized protein n=1 Tax=[Myrmecia] bisecta TaxID=41462 RepID=A0AAW1PTB9_9CHLO
MVPPVAQPAGNHKALKPPVSTTIKQWELEPSPRDVRQQAVSTAGWYSAAHRPYRPLGTPDLALPSPRDLLHAPPEEDARLQQASARRRTSNLAAPGPSSEQQAKHAQERESASRTKLPPKWCRPNLREPTAADTLMKRLKEYKRVMLRVKAGQSFLDVIHADLPNTEALALEASARHAVEQTLEDKPALNSLLGPARWLASAQKRLEGSQQLEAEPTLPAPGGLALRRTTSIGSARGRDPPPKVKMKATPRGRHRGLTDPSEPYIHFDIVGYLDSVSSMPALPTSTVEAEANAAFASLTAQLKGDSSAHPDGSRTARPATTAEELVQFLPGEHDISVLRNRFQALNSRLDSDLAARLAKMHHERAATYRKKAHNFTTEITANCEKNNLTAEIAAVRYRARMEAMQEALLRMKRTDWVRPILEMLESHARRLSGVTAGEKMLAKQLFDTLFQGRAVELADVRRAVVSIPDVEHYQPGVQDVVTLLCRFMNIPVKDLWKWYAESKGLDTCSRIMKAYELRWRLVDPGFTPLKAVQKFMRPVKEIREGFYSEEPGSGLAPGGSGPGIASGGRKQSLMRKHLSRYSSLDSGVGGAGQGAQQAQQAQQASRASRDYLAAAAVEDNKHQAERRVQFAAGVGGDSISKDSSNTPSAQPSFSAALAETGPEAEPEPAVAQAARPEPAKVPLVSPLNLSKLERVETRGQFEMDKFSGTFSRAMLQPLS